MTYLLIEIQAMNEDHGGTATVVTPIWSGKDINKAISKFHGVCVYAADPDLSTYDIHTIMLIDSIGNVVPGCYASFVHPHNS